LLLPAAAVLGVVSTMLQGSGIRLIYALIPFFLLDAVLLGFTAFFFIRASLEGADERQVLTIAGLVTTFVLTVALVPQVWASVVDWRDGVVPAAPLLVTASVAAGLLAIGGCVLSDRLCKRAREGAFVALYSRDTWCGEADDARLQRLLPRGAGAHAVVEVGNAVEDDIDAEDLRRVMALLRAHLEDD